MSIDPKMVKWDAAPEHNNIDPRMVNWVDVPAGQNPQSKLYAPDQQPAPQFNPQDVVDNFMPLSYTLPKNIAAGGLNALGKIGGFFMRGPDALAQIAGIENAWIGRNDRQQVMHDTAVNDLGGDPNSLGWKGGGLAVDLAATGGTGGLITKGVLKLAPSLATSTLAAPILTAVETGGARSGVLPTAVNGAKALAPTWGVRAADLGSRMLGGGINGAASTALTGSDNIGSGAVVGAALPMALSSLLGSRQYGSEALRSAAERLMRSTLKPSKSALMNGDADTAVKMLLGNGINVTKGGVDKLNNMIEDLNGQISNNIANSTATINKSDVANSLSGLRERFTNQVDPLPDLNAIQGVSDRFAQHPLLSGDQIPVQLAQSMKQGTYQQLAKKYGQLGSADIEAQKSLARGLKEGIADAVPSIGGLNAQESQLIKALSVTEQRVFQQMNNNPLGLAGLASNPKSWVAMMADKSPLFKSLMARSLNSIGNLVQNPQSKGGFVSGLLDNPDIQNGLIQFQRNAPVAFDNYKY